MITVFVLPVTDTVFLSVAKYIRVKFKVKANTPIGVCRGSSDRGMGDIGKRNEKLHKTVKI